jgi:hypothetical protein
MTASGLLDRILFGPDRGPRRRALEQTLTASASSGSSPVSPVASVDGEKKIDAAGPGVKVKVKGIKRIQSLIQREPGSWQPSFLQVRPISGILALCVSTGCVFAGLVILLLSDNSPVSPNSNGWFTKHQVTEYRLIDGLFSRRCISLSSPPVRILESRWQDWKESRSRGGTQHRIAAEQLDLSSDNGRFLAASSRPCYTAAIRACCLWLVSPGRWSSSTARFFSVV